MQSLLKEGENDRAREEPIEIMHINHDSDIYADKPQTLDRLEDNIRRVIADIRPQMLEKVIENWTSRLDYIRASLCQKSYLKCNAIRLSFE
ncbi:hypothetical protein TNCV_2142801 [Trichonephila clavipes]|nr:hypothetical protein TNCV_2142801 [Trichonephila clavipes]